MWHRKSFVTAYSSEENGIVERANEEVLRHLRALLFDSGVHDKWSFEQLPLVQRIMNTVEKTSTGAVIRYVCYLIYRHLFSVMLNYLIFHYLVG
jgi:hypothetical protein